MTRQPLPAFVFEVVLGSASYRLRFSWNSRFAHWLVDLMRPDDTPIVEGRKLVLGVPLFQDLQVAGLPAPALVALAPAGKLDRIAFADLGQGVTLYAIGGDDAL